jgi:outer membrane immunogenic protein
MRRIAIALLASTSLLGLASVAEAADLAVRKAPPPPPPAPIWSWTGFYIGAHIGAGWARNEFHTKDNVCLTDFFDGRHDFDGFRFGCENTDRGSHNAIGGLGGAQVGFNWQAGWWLFGVEAQYSWANLEGDHLDSRSEKLGVIFANVSTDVNTRFHTDVKGIGTIAARLGIVSGPQDRTLFYVKGGAAYVKQDFQEVINASVLGCIVGFCLGDTFDAEASGSHSRWGWMIGAGLELGLWDNWSAKIEYNYLKFKEKDVTLSGSGCFNVFDPLCESPVAFDRVHKLDTDIQVIKVGLNYRFGWFGKAPAVMAKY